uniref:Nuclear shuttle protein n=1 Tax=Indian cassava mosaic virus-[Ker5] TaxID=358182 RepID=Q2YHN5_ICMV|nr:nuclear shuttle protein [Indian cassava mosaic virus-[Ker5]]
MRRGAYTPRSTPFPRDRRSYNAGKGRSFRSYRRRGPVRPLARRNLFGDDHARAFTYKTLSEDQFGPDFTIHNNNYKSSYISCLPNTRALSDNRVGDYIKLVNISFTGTVCIKNSQMESDGSPMLGLHGLFTCVLVRDKTPRIYSATEPLIPFPQLFGSINASYADLSIQDPYKDRFTVIRQVSYPVNTEKGDHMCRFKGTRRFVGRYPIWTSFKDDGGSGDSSGLYSNTYKNAILVYYVWLSDVSSQLEMYCKYVTRYIG